MCNFHGKSFVLHTHGCCECDCHFKIIWIFMRSCSSGRAPMKQRAPGAQSQSDFYFLLVFPRSVFTFFWEWRRLIRNKFPDPDRVVLPKSTGDYRTFHGIRFWKEQRRPRKACPRISPISYLPSGKKWYPGFPHAESRSSFQRSRSRKLPSALASISW